MDKTKYGVHKGHRVPSIWADTPEGYKNLPIIVDLMSEYIVQQRKDQKEGTHFGLLFYKCGYDGQAQTEVQNNLLKRYQVHVF